MIGFLQSWLSAVLGVVVILGVLLWSRWSNGNNEPKPENQDESKPEENEQYRTPIKESIRQIALIEKKMNLINFTLLSSNGYRAMKCFLVMTR